MIYKHKGDGYRNQPDRHPGHVDFSYEVHRALQACEGAILVVDASQGIQAQTMAHLFAALEQKPDHRADHQQDRPARRHARRCGTGDRGTARHAGRRHPAHQCRPGINVEEVLEQVIEQVPPPKGNRHQPLRALVFDCRYDPYKGVIAYVRVVDGAIEGTPRLLAMNTGKMIDPWKSGCSCLSCCQSTSWRPDR